MKKLLIITVVTMLGLLNFSVIAKESLEKRMSELEQTVVDLEIKSLQSKINFSGRMENGAAYYNMSRNHEEPKKVSKPAFHNRFTLNANASVTNNLSVYSSVQASHFYGDSLMTASAPGGGILFPNDGEYLRVIKAYFDYDFLDKKMIVSAGRLSTIEGPPQHYYSMDSRLGTYPLLAYSVPFDGIAMTVDLDKILGMDDSLAFRFVFAPLALSGRSAPWDGVDGENSSGAASGNVINDTNMYTAMMDYSTTRFKGIFDRVNFIVQGIHAEFHRAKPVQKTGVLTSEYAADNNVYEIYFDSEKAMLFQGIIGHLDLENIADTGLDFYASYKWSKLKNKAHIKAKIVEDNVTPALAAVAVPSPLGPAGTIYPLGGFIVNDKKIGSTILLGSRFKLNSTNAVGAEYITSTLGSMPTSAHTQRNTPFYTVIGRGYHGYFSHTFASRSSNIRFGYSNTLSTHTMSLETDLQYKVGRERIHEIYTLLSMNF